MRNAPTHHRQQIGQDRWIGPALVLLIISLWLITRFGPSASVDAPRHPPGGHGGVIVSLPGERLHVEALIEREGTLRLFLLGRDAARIVDVEEQSLTAHVTAGDRPSAVIELVPDPQPGDAPGRTSRFVGQLPSPSPEGPLNISLAPLRIGRERYRVRLTWNADHPVPEMPQKIVDDAERELYLVPGGKYTRADILANGEQTASERYRGFQARHDVNPQPGDMLCPVTRTKANPDCTWIINGNAYRFCCPPCIDELVQLAKRQPEQLRPPEEFILQEE